MQIDWTQAYSFLEQGETHARPLVGISACLCGDNVRYDGQVKGQLELVHRLKKKLRLLKICPEVAIGMGVPRPPIELIRVNLQQEPSIAAVGAGDSSLNITTALKKYAQSVIVEHASSNEGASMLCGFILKNRSPSCGVNNTPIHENGRQIAFGHGVFSQQLQQQLPWLPVIGEEALNDDLQQQRFICRCQLVELFWQHYQRRNLAAFQPLISHLIAQLNVAEKSALASGINAAQQQPEQYLTQLMSACSTK